MSRTSQRLASRPDGSGVVLEDVTRTFGGTSVFEDVSLSIGRGETVAIIGPSGAGKTTLLRILGLFQRPDAGTVRVAGEDVWSRPESSRLEARRRVGTVFQEPNLFSASARRNVEYGLQVRRTWGERIRRSIERLVDPAPEPAVERALETVGLADAADRDVDSLSGGEAQRVAFARALAYEPEFLFLDEPTSDLDPHNTALLEEAIEAARRRGIGVAVATHDMHQARRIADRVAVLLGGSIIEVGQTDRVFTDPDDPRTRKFVDGELVY